MTPRTSRIPPHTESPYTTLDHLAALTHSRISRGYLRIPCPAHGGTNPNLALWVNDEGIAARCHSAGCSYADIARATLDRYGISINPRRYHDNPAAAATTATSARTAPGPGPNAPDLRPYALRLWRRSVPIPNSRDHPARLWLAARQLWRPELPLPAPVRWIGAEHLRRECQGAGAIIAMSAPPDAWTTSWPGLPDLSSAHLVYIAGDGSPAVDRGLTKRTYAAVQDAVVVLGCPLLEQTMAPVDVAEGLADALALASRSPAPAVATLGTSGMSSATIAQWLATSPDTRVWADRDEAREGRAPPGQRYGRGLVRMVNDAGGNADRPPRTIPAQGPRRRAAAVHRVQRPRSGLAGVRQDTLRDNSLAQVGDRPAGHGHVCGGSAMTMKGEPVPPEGLDHIKSPSAMAGAAPKRCHGPVEACRDLQRDPRFAEPDEPDDIMPQVPELAEFPVPPGLKKYIDAARIVAGASVPTSAACIAAAFNLLAAEDIDVQSRANAPHPAGLYFVVGSESGWRKSASFRETMKGHVEADERVDALHHEAGSNTEEGAESRLKGFSPRALRQDFTIEALLSPALEGPQDHGGGQQRRLIAPRRLEFPQGQPEPVPQPFRLPMGRRPDVHRPAQPRGPRDILLPAPSHRPDHGPGQRHRGPAVQPGRGQRVHRQVPAQLRPGETEASVRHVHVLSGRTRHDCRHARAGHTSPGGPGRQRRAAARRPAPAGDPPGAQRAGIFSPPPQPSSTPWRTQQTTSTNGVSGPGPRSRRPGTPPPWPTSGRWRTAYPSPGSMSTTPARRSTRPRPSSPGTET